MTITETYIEKYCNELLQQNLIFEIKNKILKKGKVVLFFQRNFHIVFVLENDKKVKEKLELPIPFDIEFYKDEKLMFFDYRVLTLSKKYPESEPYLSLYSNKGSKSKYFNNILSIYQNKSF